MATRNDKGAVVTQQVGAYNVYMGARYVPLIKGEWDNTQNYEPLSIVINQGNSYTSAQYVPAGIPLQENGPYWYLTGNFNGQIASVITDINNLKISNSEILADINTINANVVTINSDIDTIKDDIEEINIKIGVTNKNIVVFF